MFISVVIGTYNRLDLLKELIASVRATIPSWLSYEIILVDNGSSDGTEAWAKQQDDIQTLLQMGRPVGAIRAYTDGAKEAIGKYVLFAMDDISFPSMVIVRAFSYLENHPQCGAVAFAHNRRNSNQHSVDYQNTVGSDGKSTAVPYPQIALIRKSVGDAAGWWGADGPMREAFTYGGDNYLGCRIYELGFTVDAVSGVYENERLRHDDGRKMNYAHGKQDADLFLKLYPNATCRSADLPQLNLEQKSAMRILYINHFEPGNLAHHTNKRGLKEALQRRGIVWEYDFAAAGNNAPQELISIAKAFLPNLILSQIHRPTPIGAEAIRAIRQAAPNAVAINWIGDVWMDMYTSNLSAWREFDALGVVNGDAIGGLQAEGVQAFYWQNAFEPVVELPDTPAFDVVFQGNGYSPARKALALNLKALPCKVGLFGNGLSVQPDGETNYDFARGRALYRNAKIAISDDQFKVAGFVSNRLFEIAAAQGAVCFQQYVPNLEDYLGFIDGKHYIGWSDWDDLKEKIVYWLRPEQETKRRGIAIRAYKLAFERHTFDHRVDELFLKIRELAEAHHVYA